MPLIDKGGAKPKENTDQTKPTPGGANAAVQVKDSGTPTPHPPPPPPAALKDFRTKTRQRLQKHMRAAKKADRQEELAALKEKASRKKIIQKSLLFLGFFLGILLVKNLP